MCGIFGYLSYLYQDISEEYLKEYFDYGKKRGPEFSSFSKIYKNLYFGFHRLAINGLDEVSNQPFIQDGICLICNGEIYNHEELFDRFNLKRQTNSDCEIIIALYKLMGVNCFNLLDGVFSCLLFDYKTQELVVARDPHGVRPLYVAEYADKTVGFASDLKPLLFKVPTRVNQFPNGHFMVLDIHPLIEVAPFFSARLHKYFNFDVTQPYSIVSDYKGIEHYMCKCVKLLKNSVRKRVQNCERSVACLLSGGLDSSIISAFVARFYKEKTGNLVETYSIGLEGGEDLKFSNLVANHIMSLHTNVIKTNEGFLESIPIVISDVESYDTTTVRASVGNWNIGKYIKSHSSAKVIFNGDGADELMGGYLYFHHCPNNEEFHSECVNLLQNIKHFDVLRSDKSISSHGLEPRTPFLDKEFTQFYLSIPIEYRNHNIDSKCEKWFIRKAIELFEPDLLPKEVLWRTKEAFSDGVSSNEKSWYEIIQEYSETITNESLPSSSSSTHTTVDKTNINPKTKEQKYYYDIFKKEFGSECANIIPYYWLPKYIDTEESSARALNIYKTRQDN